MLERDPKTLARLQTVVTELIEHRVATSLVDVERALAQWRRGAQSALGAHGAVLKHAARCERTVERVTAAAGDRPEGILRDAVDAGLMQEAEFVELVGKPSSEIPSIDALRDDDDANAPDKKKTLEALLARGPVLVHVDGRRADAAVPPRFRHDPSLVLRFGYGLTPAIADLLVDDDGVSGTLMFAGQPFHVMLPWAVVYAAMVEGEQRGTVWPEDVPEDVLTSAATGPGAAPAPTATATATGPALAADKSDAGVDSSAPRPAVLVDLEPDAPRKRGGHLKLVD
jgi:stringent starvation protein B